MMWHSVVRNAARFRQGMYFAISSHAWSPNFMQIFLKTAISAGFWSPRNKYARYPDVFDPPAASDSIRICLVFGWTSSSESASSGISSDELSDAF